MIETQTLHYVVRVAGDQAAFEYDTFDEACDAVILGVPNGVEFVVGRVLDVRFDVLVRATKSTNRPFCTS